MSIKCWSKWKNKTLYLDFTKRAVKRRLSESLELSEILDAIVEESENLIDTRDKRRKV